MKISVKPSLLEFFLKMSIFWILPETNFLSKNFCSGTSSSQDNEANSQTEPIWPDTKKPEMCIRTIETTRILYIL